MNRDEESTRIHWSSPLEDNLLVAAAANGDQESFSILVERYRAYIYAIAYRITLNEDDALDVTQNVYLRVVQKIGNFNGRGAFRSWLATIAAREAVDHLRRPSRRESATDPEILANLSETRHNHRSASDPREALDKAQRRRLVEEAMVALSPQQRAIFALRFREEMGPKEIAERLELPAGQVRSQLHRAIARIRRSLAGKME